MCGILAAVGATAEELAAAARTMTHRGPDAHGACEDGGIALAHRRLAIIDLSGGAQPMVLTDHPVSITFNGEIYNHLELREVLAARGHRFRTSSDTETLLAAYVEYGTACLGKLRGMYAFLIHDRRTGTLFGARDPFGKKPLYYMERPGQRVSFAVASEPRALLELLPPGERGLSHEGIASYLLHDYVVGEQSAFAAIKRLPPGAAFTRNLHDQASWRQWLHWRPVVSTTHARPTDARDAIAGVRTHLARAVERRLIADVPVGVLLSGGVDSSVIAALMAQVVGRDTVASFSMGFDDPRFDESPFAREVAERVGTRHNVMVFRPENCLAQLDRIVGHVDEPFADPSLLPTAMLCEFARQSVTVALGGDGGDELFAGYDPFLAVRPARIARALVPAPFDPLLKHAATWLPAESRATRFSAQFKASRFLRGFRAGGVGMITAWMGPFDLPGLKALSPDLARQYGRVVVDDDEPDDDAASVLQWYQRRYLTEDILVKGDRASMMHSLEVRSPFLDLDLAEYVNALPLRLKLHGNERKVLLREVVQSWDALNLPPSLLTRPKRGFGIPVATWFREELRSMLLERVVHAWPRTLDFISRTERERLVNVHLSGAQNLYKELWALVVLSMWAERWVP